jgi:hypothetical protein
VLRDVSTRLDAAELPFMLTGSLALNFYAQPRMTRDVDLAGFDAAYVARWVNELGLSEYWNRATVG